MSYKGTALSIAGSDPSGGAGIQGDLKTFAAHGVYGMGVITALTAQNTLGVSRVDPVSPEILEAQLRSVLEDIRPGAVKVGMLGTEDNIRTVAAVLRECREANIVVDPVLAATSGTSLLEEGGRLLLMAELFPLARLITPNIPEAEILCGFPIGCSRDALRALETLQARTGTAVLLKGGHAPWTGNRSVDLLWDGCVLRSFSSPRIAGNTGHGTGCALSSAIAAQLARGDDLYTALRRAKAYLTRALRSPFRIGRGQSPLDHS